MIKLWEGKKIRSNSVTNKIFNKTNWAELKKKCLTTINISVLLLNSWSLLDSASIWLRPYVCVSVAWNTCSLLLAKSEQHYIWNWYVKSFTPKNSEFLDGCFSNTDACLHQVFEMLSSKTRHPQAFLAPDYCW